MIFKFIQNEKEVHPFDYRARVYCAKCSKRGKWKEVDETSSSNNEYKFKCHGNQVTVNTKEFMENHLIQGPRAFSFIIFHSK